MLPKHCTAELTFSFQSGENRRRAVKAKILIDYLQFRVNWEERYGGQQVSTVENISIWDGEWWTTDRHVYLYSILIGVLMFLAVVRSFSFYNMCLRISKNLHDKLYYGVTRATMVFFHQNSTGRVLNRFSKDIGSIDSQLPVIIADCIEVRFVKLLKRLKKPKSSSVFP